MRNPLSGSIKEEQADLRGGTGLTSYKPRLSENLGTGSITYMTRLQPASPRGLWWLPFAANTFSKGIKLSFEVHEQLLDILGTHLRIIRYVDLALEHEGAGLKFEIY